MNETTLLEQGLLHLCTSASFTMLQVFGVPDTRMGEEVAAWIRLTDNAAVDEHGIRQLCKGKVRPVTILFIYFLIYHLYFGG